MCECFFHEAEGRSVRDATVTRLSLTFVCKWCRDLKQSFAVKTATIKLKLTIFVITIKTNYGGRFIPRLDYQPLFRTREIGGNRA